MHKHGVGPGGGTRRSWQRLFNYCGGWRKGSELLRMLRELFGEKQVTVVG